MRIQLSGAEVEELAARLGLDYDPNSFSEQGGFRVLLTPVRCPGPILGIYSYEGAEDSSLQIKTGGGFDRSWHSVLDAGLSETAWPPLSILKDKRER